jgi:hypothetical protein
VSKRWNVITFTSDLSIVYSISNTKRIIYTWSDTNADYIRKENWLHVQQVIRNTQESLIKKTNEYIIIKDAKLEYIPKSFDFIWWTQLSFHWQFHRCREAVERLRDNPL